jgi:hypothetical protein
VVAAEVVEKDGKQVDVAVLDLPDLGEGTVKLSNDLYAG